MYKCTVVRPSTMSLYAARAHDRKTEKYGPEVSLGHSDCQKVLSSRHVRMDRTHTGKFSAESVRGRKAECAAQR